MTERQESNRANAQLGIIIFHSGIDDQTGRPFTPAESAKLPYSLLKAMVQNEILSAGTLREIAMRFRPQKAEAVRELVREVRIF